MVKIKCSRPLRGHEGQLIGKACRDLSDENSSRREQRVICRDYHIKRMGHKEKVGWRAQTKLS